MHDEDLNTSVYIQKAEQAHATANDEKIPVSRVIVSAYKIPTDFPEADGTFSWDSTTLILVEIEAGGKNGIGYTYANEAVAFLIDRTLKEMLIGKNALHISYITDFLIKQLRNNGTTGIAMMAVSAVDNALWDLKAKIAGIPLCSLLGQVKNNISVYGSGGFTSYSTEQLQRQFIQWVDEGIQYMKMKVGMEPQKDMQRIEEARAVLKDNVQLMIDANGAYTIKQALQKAEESASYNITWFEEPVSSDNLKGLRFISEHAPAGMNITAGEYGYNLPYFLAMLDAKAVHVLQADATRCGGITGFIKAGVLAEAYQVPFSSHCAPALHLHAAVALPSFFIAEYFHDHARIEQMLFEGAMQPLNGVLKPDDTRPGLGLTFKYRDAEKYRL